MNIQKTNNAQSINFGRVGNSPNPNDFPPTHVKDGAKEIMEGLQKASQGLRAMLVKPGMCSSAPEITNAEEEIRSEIGRLMKRNHSIETIDELKEKGFNPKVDSDGIFTTCGMPYGRILELEDGSLVEFKDGKPVTIVKNVANGNHIDKKLIKYEYPEGSIAALRTEINVVQETNYNKGQISYKVPPSIQKEAGLI